MNIQRINQKLEKTYQQKYGVAVFDIEVKKVKEEIIITGKVLTESQRDDILSIFKKEKIKIADLKILSDASERNEMGWAVVKVKIADLKSRFVSNKILNDKILKRIRCSQVFRGEVLRVLFKEEDQLLVQSNDSTLGWVNRNEVILKKGSLYRRWKCGNFALKNKIVKINKSKFAKRLHSSAETMEPAIEEAEKFLGVKYLLGGKSEKGIDCSGLTQVVYKNVFKIILPRHSWDQKKVGKKINLKNIETGDLIFLIKKSDQHKHVGIVERNINLIHASLEKKKVIRQKLDEVFEKYDFVEARRIVEF